MDLPPKQGLYDPRNEHDACGVGFVANIKGAQDRTRSSAKALQILINLDHRGAVGADPLLGDGAGILIQIPDALLRDWAEQNGIDACRRRATTRWRCASCRRTPRRRDFVVEQLRAVHRKVEGQTLLGWRDVPTDTDGPRQGGASRRCR